MCWSCWGTKNEQERIMYIVDSGGYIYIQIKERRRLRYYCLCESCVGWLGVLGTLGPRLFRIWIFLIGISSSARISESLSQVILLLVHTYMDASPDSIGEIKFEIFRTTIPEKSKKNAEKAKRQSTSSFRRAPSNSQKVHERSKKAIAYQMTYMASLTCSYNTWHWNPINSYGTELNMGRRKFLWISLKD